MNLRCFRLAMFSTLCLSTLLSGGAKAELPSTPSWIGELNIAQIRFGTDVASAGDVNGDGYSDALATTPAYPGGGGAFVFHGSASGLSAAPDWIGQEGHAAAHFGISGSTAGDINGDGYDDVIVGCWGFTGGEDTEGAAYVFHGSASGLSPSFDWMVESNVERASFGESVGAAGDVNGDGYADVIVGAYEYEAGQTKEGAAFVYFGSSTGLSTTADWTFQANQAWAAVGSSVYGAGDVNADGYDDIIVGGVGYGGTGRIWVFLGSSSGPSPTPDWFADAAQSGAALGSSVGPAGDVNGDGYSDIIAGAPGYGSSQADEGAAYVFYGSASGLEATPAWIEESNSTGARFGTSVRTAGDVNADGYADVIVGARSFVAAGPDAGKAFLFYGGPAGLDTLAPWSYSGGEAHAHVGDAVSGVGDVNGDGLSDVIVGAPSLDNGEFDEGLALVFYGQFDGPTRFPATWSIEGDADEQIGSYLSEAGDINGDGLGDFLIAAPFVAGSGSFRGRVYVCEGSTTGQPTVATILEGSQDVELLGAAIDDAGDVNGDGYGDIIVGAPLYDGAMTNIGRTMVYFGSASGVSTTPDWQIEGTQDGSFSGAQVSGAGDVNGDGFTDVLIGATRWSNGEADEGVARLYYGSATGPSPMADWSYESDQEGAELGDVQGVGDLNGDGFADIAVGASLYSGSHLNEGVIFIFYGSATGPSATPDWMFTPDQQTAYMSTTARAGDLNGDGFDDLVMSCNNFHGSAGVLSGRVWIYHGSAAGISGTADTILEGETTNEYFGYSIDGAGDVNGDGFADIIAGGYLYDAGFDNQGVARIYLGSASGVSTTADWEIVTEQDESELGRAVCTAGDINGDGFADVVSSAPTYDGSDGVDTGRVQLHLGGGRWNPEGAVSLRPRQTNFDGSPLPLRGTTREENRVQLHVDARSPMGRDRIEVQWQMVPDGTAIETGPIVAEPIVDTGLPSGDGSIAPVTIDVTGLTPETAYQWRVRLRFQSPFVPYSRWLTVSPAVPSMVLFRTGEETVSTVPSASELRNPLLSVGPNPMQNRTRVSYAIALAGRVRVTIVDPTGREVAELTDGIRLAGRYTTDWNGRTHNVPAAAGVYFVRVETDSGVISRKLTVLR